MKNLLKIGTVVLVSLLFVSCSKVNQNPEAVFQCSTFDGSDVAYYSVGENGLCVMSESCYNSLTSGSDSDFEKVGNIEVFLFTVEADGSDPSSWEYEQSESDYVTYDQQLLISELEYLGVSYSGHLYVLIYEFDDYKRIEVKSRVENLYAETDSEFSYVWLLCDEEIVENPDNIELNLIREAYVLDNMK